VGVTFRDFNQRIQDLATELALAIDKVHTEQEAGILLNYTEALNEYRESQRLWSSSIESDENFMFVSADIIAKYEVPDSEIHMRTSPYGGTPYKTYYVDGVNQRIWASAGKKLDEARRLIPSATTAADP
jgi:hypothetical protein